MYDEKMNLYVEKSLCHHYKVTQKQFATSTKKKKNKGRKDGNKG